MCLNARATFYEAAGGTGNCGHGAPGSIPAAVFGTTAVNTAAYANGAACGECYEFNTSTGPIIVMVTDQCPADSNQQWCSGDLMHFDLDHPVFSAMAQDSLGVVRVAPRLVDCPVGNITLQVMDGSNPYWFAIFAFNHKVGLANVEVLPVNTASFLPAERQTYNAWVHTSATGTSSMTVRLTSVLGEVVTSTVPITPGTTGQVDTGVQFQQGYGSSVGVCMLPSTWP